MTTDLWIQALRKYLGTPFHHKGRNALGLDCVGLLICAGSDCGLISDADVLAYGHIPPLQAFRDNCSKFLTPYNRLQRPAVGDVFVFWIDHRRHPRHLAVLTEVSDTKTVFIHSYAQQRAVVETVLTNYWGTRIFSRWCVTSLAEGSK